MNEYEVIVGNIGAVYSGKSKKEAVKNYQHYVIQSRENYGRAAGEDVVLMKNGEPIREFIGSLQTEEA